MRALCLTVLALGCHRGPPGDDGETGDDDDDAEGRLRIATWNIEYLGDPGSTEFDAVATILARIDADVIGLNEVDSGEADDLEAMADGLGYDVVVAATNPFGTQRNAILSRLPIESSEVWSSAALSGDGQADDVTRMPVTVVVRAPWGASVGVAVQHAKSGFEDIDEFRRIVDITRTVQAVQATGADVSIVLGDMNEDRRELLDDPLFPSVFSDIPSGTPGGYWLGADLYAALTGPGLVNDPFISIEDAGLVEVATEQLDGRVETRDSGRLIDYVFVGPGVVVLGSEIYDSTDEGNSGALEKAGSAPLRETVRDASDHLPVLVDLGG